MTDASTPEGPKRRGAGLQTKALAGLVAVMLAAAIVALVFVTNGGGNSSSKDRQAGGQSDVAHMSSSTPSAKATTSAATPSTSTAPSTTAPTTTKAAPTTSAPSSTTAASSTSPAASHSPSSRSITYTVKKGDNLTVIAAWFHQHGFGKLYDLNKSVIGENPNLIFPGEKITISGGSMTTH